MKNKYKTIGISILTIIIIIYLGVLYFSGKGEKELVKNNTESIYVEEENEEVSKEMIVENKKKLDIKDMWVINIILEYNKALPILSEDGDGFCINARDLHSQLGIRDVYSRWIKNSLISIDAVKDVDYSHAFKRIGNYSDEEISNMSTNKRNSLGITDEYYLTLNCAKEIAMVIGVLPRISKDTKEKSKKARKYFIAIEKVLKKAIEWELIRKPEKKLYKEMCEELKLYMLRNFNKVE